MGRSVGQSLPSGKNSIHFYWWMKTGADIYFYFVLYRLMSRRDIAATVLQYLTFLPWDYCLGLPTEAAESTAIGFWGQIPHFSRSALVTTRELLNIVEPMVFCGQLPFLSLCTFYSLPFRSRQSIEPLLLATLDAGATGNERLASPKQDR